MTTPTTFLRLWKATQAERDAAPCVAPVEGLLALLRDGSALTVTKHFLENCEPDGSIWGIEGFKNHMDIIATLDLLATLERLEELEQ